MAAGAGALIQRWDEDYLYVLPVVMVSPAIVLMALVVRLNHGGLVSGEPQFGPRAPEPAGS